MSNASVVGRKNRNKGNDNERAISKYFRDEFGINIVTARSLSGGRSVGVDLLYPDGSIPEWAIECKDDPNISVNKMLKQAEEQSQGHKYCAIRKARRQPIKMCSVYVPCKYTDFCGGDCTNWLEMSLEHFATMWLSSGEISHYVSD